MGLDHRSRRNREVLENTDSSGVSVEDSDAVFVGCGNEPMSANVARLTYFAARWKDCIQYPVAGPIEPVEL